MKRDASFFLGNILESIELIDEYTLPTVKEDIERLLEENDHPPEPER